MTQRRIVGYLDGLTGPVAALARRQFSRHSRWALTRKKTARNEFGHLAEEFARVAANLRWALWERRLAAIVPGPVATGMALPQENYSNTGSPLPIRSEEHYGVLGGTVLDAAGGTALVTAGAGGANTTGRSSAVRLYSGIVNTSAGSLQKTTR